MLKREKKVQRKKKERERDQNPKHSVSKTLSLSLSRVLLSSPSVKRSVFFHAHILIKYIRFASSFSRERERERKKERERKRAHLYIIARVPFVLSRGFRFVCVFFAFLRREKRSYLYAYSGGEKIKICA